MSDDHDPEDKTEDASERRIERALEQGDVPRSQDLQGFVTLSAGCAAALATAAFMARDVAAQLAAMLANAHAARPDMPLATTIAATMGAVLAAPMLACIVAAMASGMILHRPQIASDPLMPKFSRISPMSGLKRLIGKDNMVAFAKTVLKLAAVIGVTASVLWPERASIVRLATLDLAESVVEGGRLVVRLIVSVLVLYAGIAVFDAVYQYLAWKKRLRMSLQEVKDESKESEGNPEIKAKLRAIRQQRMRRRMMAAVPRATVILANPTHYSVALRYEKGMRAPVCVAKGADETALKIREIAGAHRIPVITNAPLARALHAGVEIDEEIPAEHFKAVAEVIGFVLRASRSGRRRTDAFSPKSPAIG